MSTKSGITVSEALLDKFKGLQNILIIKVSEDETQLVPYKEIQYDADNASVAFEELNKHFTQNHPTSGYIIIPADQGSYSFISFVPDSSPARQKMLYASTKSTALTTLGSNKFPSQQTFEWTDLDELSNESYSKSLKQESDGLISEREKAIQELDSLNSSELVDASSTYGFKRKLASMSTQEKLIYDFESDLEDKIISSINGSLSARFLIVFNIDSEKNTIALQQNREGTTPDQLISTLSNNEVVSSPKYCLYNYTDGKLAFIYSCPSGSSVKSRMTYASFKQGVINHLNGLLNTRDLKIDKSLEVGDIDEIELSELKAAPADVEGNRSNKAGLRFSKPKGPRRR